MLLPSAFGSVMPVGSEPGVCSLQAVDHVDDRRVGGGDRPRAVDRVVGGLGGVAAALDEPIAGVDLLPVDREALGQPLVVADRQQRPPVARRRAAAVGSDIAPAGLQRWTQYGNVEVPEHLHARGRADDAAVGQPPRLGDDPVHEPVRDRRALLEVQREIERRLLALGQSADAGARARQRQRGACLRRIELAQHGAVGGRHADAGRGERQRRPVVQPQLVGHEVAAAGGVKRHARLDRGHDERGQGRVLLVAPRRATDRARERPVLVVVATAAAQRERAGDDAEHAQRARHRYELPPIPASLPHAACT